MMNLLLRQSPATNGHTFVRRSLKALSIEASHASGGVLYHRAKPLRNGLEGALDRLIFRAKTSQFIRHCGPNNMAA
jgi:hypothetical protein